MVTQIPLRTVHEREGAREAKINGFINQIDKLSIKMDLIIL